MHEQHHAQDGQDDELAAPLALLRPRPGGQVTLSGSIPWHLRVRGGTAHTSFDLGGLTLYALELGGGAGHVALTLPEPAGTVPIRVAGGAHNVTALRPAGVAVRVRVRRDARSLTLDTQAFGAIGGSTRWQNPDYDHTADRYDIAVSGRVDTLTVHTPGNRAWLARPNHKRRAPGDTREDNPDARDLGGRFMSQARADGIPVTRLKQAALLVPVPVDAAVDPASMLVAVHERVERQFAAHQQTEDGHPRQYQAVSAIATALATHVTLEALLGGPPDAVTSLAPRRPAAAHTLGTRPPPVPDGRDRLGLRRPACPVSVPCIHDLLVPRHRRRSDDDRC